MQFTRRDFLRFSSAVLTLPMLPSIAAAEDKASWSFGVMPDTQWANDMDAPFYGTAIHIIDAINAEFIRRNVDFVLQVGDLVERSSAPAFQTRAAHNKSLNDAGIRFYPLRGNHDSIGLESVAQFTEAFPDLPGTANGGGSSPKLPGAAGMTYSFTHKGGKFILLDTFPLYDDGSRRGRAYTIANYLPWIEAELAKDDHQFALVFAHKNLLGQNHKDNLFGDDAENQDSHPKMQNAFIDCLQRYGVRYVMSGHDHMYNRSLIRSVNGQSKVGQIICGSAAHKFYQPQPPFSKRETLFVQELNRIGFMIVHVEGTRVRFEYYSTEPFGAESKTPTWELRDAFE